MAYWKNDDEDLHEMWPEQLDEYIAPVPKESYELLNPRQRVLYAHERKEFFEWFLDRGKNPDKYEGYSVSSLPPKSSRIDQFYRWVWSEFGGFRRSVGPKHADSYVSDVMAPGDSSVNDKRKTNNSLSILMRYKGYDGWDPPVEWNDETSSSPSDYLDYYEMQDMRSVSTEVGSVPPPGTLDNEDLQKWKSILSQHWGTPKEDISEDDFALANSWKIPSLVHVSTDIGPRPWEIKRWTVDRIRIPDDSNRGKIVIPKDESVKNKDNWECTLSESSTDILRRWKKERELHEDYDEGGKIWRTSEGNPHEKQSLRRLIIRIMEASNIETDGRRLGWYLFRTGAATHIANQDDTSLETVMEQLRIKRPETALRYIKHDEDHVRNKVLM